MTNITNINRKKIFPNGTIVTKDYEIFTPLDQESDILGVYWHGIYVWFNVTDAVLILLNNYKPSCLKRCGNFIYKRKFAVYMFQ